MPETDEKSPTEKPSERRAKACNYCKSLKVRCVPFDESNPDGICVRCQKGRRECVFYFGPRKKRKTKENRMSVLEKKIEQLSAALQAEEGTRIKREVSSAEPSTAPSSVPHSPPKGLASTPLLVPPPEAVPATRPGFVPDFDIQDIRTKLRDYWRAMSDHDSARLENLENSPRPERPGPNTDIVAQGLVSAAEAEYRLHLFREQFHQRLPVLTLSEGMTCEELRKDRPMVFLTIMSIASAAMEGTPKDGSCKPGVFYTDFNTALVISNQCIELLMYEIMIRNKKTLELLESLILINLWYNSPEMHLYHKSHILTNLCIIMAIDMGLGGYSSPSPGSKRTEPQRNVPLTEIAGNGTADGRRPPKYDQIIHPFNLLDPHTYQCRKLWLCVYIASVQLSSQLKRPMTNVWSVYTEECCEILGNDDRPRDERMAAMLARLYRIIELTGEGFQSADQKRPPDVNDPCMQTLIRYLELQMHKVVPARLKESSRDFAVQWYSLQMFLHKPVLYTRLSARLGRSPYSNFSLAMGDLTITLNVARSLGACYTSSTALIRLFNDMSVAELVSAPLTTYARIVLSASIILKLRALYLTVPEFKRVCSITSSEMQGIRTLLSKMDEALTTYPFSNCVLNYAVVLRILIYHSDRLLNFYMEEFSAEKSGQCKRRRGSSFDGYEGSGDIRGGESPLDLLSNIAADQRESASDLNEIPVASATMATTAPPTTAPAVSTPRPSTLPVSMNPLVTPIAQVPLAPLTSASIVPQISLAPSQSPPRFVVPTRPPPNAGFSGPSLTVPTPVLAGSNSISGLSSQPFPPPSQSPHHHQNPLPPPPPAQTEDLFPVWLFTDDSWKDLVSGAEALSGFEAL